MPEDNGVRTGLMACFREARRGPWLGLSCAAWILVLGTTASGEPPAVPAGPRELPADNQPPRPAAETLTGCEQCFLESDGTVADADVAYRRVQAVGPKNYWLPLVEDLSLIGIGTTWYFLDDRNVLDWDKPSFRSRFTGEAWTYDSNGFRMNFIMHPMSGTLYYGLARANHLSVGESFSYSFLTSFLWEWVLEFYEKVSISDIIMTPGAGLPIGEFLHKLAWFVNSPPRPTTGQHVLGWLLGPSVRIHQTLRQDERSTRVPTDRSGYTTDIWHDFVIGYEVGEAQHGGGPGYALHDSFFRGELVSLPGYWKPGRVQKFFHQADFSTLEAHVEYSEAGRGFRMLADTTLFGLLAQRLRPSREGQARITPENTRGYAAKIGAHLVYRYRLSEAGGFDERFGALHLPGPGFELRARTGPIEAHVLGSVHADFAGLSSPSFPRWKEQNPDDHAKSILEKQAYYYGWGWSGRASAEVRLGPFELDGAFFRGSYESHEGRDRAQELVEADLPASTDILMVSGGLAVRPPGSPLAVGATTACRRWESRLGELRRRDTLRQFGLRLAVSF